MDIIARKPLILARFASAEIQQVIVPNQLVVFSPRERPNRRYGAGGEVRKGRPKPLRPTTSSKTPVRRNRLEASGAASPLRTAPYRRFGRFCDDFPTTWQHERTQQEKTFGEMAACNHCIRAAGFSRGLVHLFHMQPLRKKHGRRPHEQKPCPI